MNSSAVDVSIVIPAYNESRRIASSLRQIEEHFQRREASYEIVVVDDGSTDETAAVVRAAQAENQTVRLLSNNGRQGKGFSVRHGVQEAAGDIVLFTDADLSAPIAEAEQLLAPIRSGAFDVTIGSRGLDRSLIGVHQPWLREQSGRFFNFFVRGILGLRFSDTQCGFKAFRRRPMLAVFERMRVLGFGFDPEMLYVASLHGLRIGEIPVRWSHAPGSKVSFARDPFSMFLDLLRIRWNHFRGLYAKEG